MSVSGHIDEEIFGKAYDSRLVGRLLRYVWPYRLSVAVAMGMLIMLTLL